MGLDVGLTFGCRIKADLLLEEHKGCPNCKKALETTYCATCGSKKCTYKIYKILDEETADKINLHKCYDGDNGYRYITESYPYEDCVVEVDDNPRAGDMMFYRANIIPQERFIQETTESIKKAFGINLTPEDFGYFITMSY